MSRSVVTIPAAALLLGSSGCMSILAQHEYWEGSRRAPRFMVYSGVQGDFLAITEGGGHALPDEIAVAVGVLDFPFSLAADTALLPLTIGETIEIALRDHHAAPPPEPR
ncbi:MAG: YceK/YidQ family lipoprotein [Planctomycetes bacterium]|nr:YceK/YidQ family lipoprotein [Planctomycetota bacterium]